LQAGRRTRGLGVSARRRTPSLSMDDGIRRGQGGAPRYSRPSAPAGHWHR
jgi:hypothetical protein